MSGAATGALLAATPAFPWLALIVFLISYVGQKKAGRSDSTAMLTGLAAGGAAYYLADPANPDNLFKIGQDTTKTGGVPATKPPVEAGSSATGWKGVVGDTVSATGGVLKEWGPTAAALGIGAAVGSKINWPLVLGGAVIALVAIRSFQ